MEVKVQQTGNGDKNRTSCVREKRAASSLYVVYVYMRVCVCTRVHVCVGVCVWYLLGEI